jgi:hypothetical protein
VKKLAATLCAAAFVALPATAFGGNAYGGNAYGNAVKECFGTSYGQAKNAAWEAGHASKPALGAKDTAIAHGCA